MQSEVGISEGSRSRSLMLYSTLLQASACTFRLRHAHILLMIFKRGLRRRIL
jgi:hypothetical protein